MSGPSCFGPSLATAGAVADVDDVLQVQRFHQRLHVIGVSVHLVAVEGLGRTTVAAPVVRQHPVPLRQKEHHLGVPVIGRKRPAMVKQDRLGIFRTPILVKDFGAVCGGNELRGHLACSPDFFRRGGGRLHNDGYGSADRGGRCQSFKNEASRDRFHGHVVPRS